MAIFLDRGFGDVNGLTQIETERPDVEAPEKYPCPAACASPWRLPSARRDTRAVVARPKWAREHGLHTECGPLCLSMEGRIDVCSNEDEGSARKTPTPCVETNRQKSEAKTKTEQHTTRNVAWTGQDMTRLQDILSAHIISHQFFAGVQTADQFACWCLPGDGFRGELTSCKLKLHIVHWVRSALAKMEGSHKLYKNGWKHSRCEGPDEAALREEAEEWLEGRLFPGHTAYGAPRNCSSHTANQVNLRSTRSLSNMKTTRTGWCSTSEKKMEMRGQQRRPQSSLSRHWTSPRKSFNRLASTWAAEQTSAKPVEEPVEQPALPPVERKVLSKFAALRIVFGE